MQNLRRILMIGLCLGMLLAACSPATPLPTPSPQPTLVPTAEPPGIGVPAFEYQNGQAKLLVISPLSGKVLDAYAPIELGESRSYTFSPDAHALAVVSNAQLYLIDLPSWKYRQVDTGLHGWLGALVFNSDASLLALAGNDADGALQIIDAARGTVRASTQVGFSIRYVRFTTDGKALMVYGPQLASTGVAANAGISVGPPKAALLAASDLSVLWSLELEGVRAGASPKDPDAAITQDIYQPGAAWLFQPGVAFAPNSDVLYIVHSDEDKLTTVDFAHQEAGTVDIRAKTSWLDQLMGLTVAHAKGMDGRIKQAIISADGKFLYVVGNTDTFIQRSDGMMEFSQSFLGLQMIATADGTLVRTIETEATSITASHAGQIFLSGWKNDSYGTSWTDVYDTASNKIIKHIDYANLMLSRNMDGKPVLISINAIGENAYYAVSVDPLTLEVLGEWHGSEYVDWLVVP